MNQIEAVQAARTAAVPLAPRSRGRPPKDPGPRRSKIVAAALDLFTAYGYSATTIEAVARESGLNKRTIYELVGDKEQLFRAICHHAATNGGLDLSDAIDETSLRNSLINLAERLLDNSLAPHTIALEKTVVAASRKFPDLIDEIVTATYAEANQKVGDYLVALRDRGLIDVTDSLAASELFFDVVVGQLAHRKALGQTFSNPGRAFVEARVDFFIRGFCRSA